MKHFIYLLILFITSSCATLTNQSFTQIDVYTTQPSVVVHKSDSVRTNHHQKATIIAKRQNQPIQIKVRNDTLSKKITLEPKNSQAYWGNLLNYEVGFLFDRKNPKRYDYPQSIYINSADTIARYFSYPQDSHKGEIYFHLSLPHINQFYLQPEDELDVKSSIGFMGVSAGFDLYHAPNQFISVNGSAVMDFFLPFPAPVDFSGEYEISSSSYLALSNNHKLERFSFGYGISYSKNVWNFIYSDRFDPPPPTRNPVKRVSKSLGMIFPIYYQINHRLHLGAIYRPSFYRLDIQPAFKYEHLISIDFAWKLQVKN